jgi:hypothetical protein
MLPQQQNMISESVRIFQNIIKYHEIAYYCLVRCLNWRCKPYIYTIFLVSETAIFLQLLNHHWVCRSSARWHPPKGYRGYDWRQTIHDGTVGWSWKKSINSACFFSQMIGHQWFSHITIWQYIDILWYMHPSLAWRVERGCKCQWIHHYVFSFLFLFWAGRFNHDKL